MPCSADNAIRFKTKYTDICIYSAVFTAYHNVVVLADKPILAIVAEADCKIVPKSVVENRLSFRRTERF